MIDEATILSAERLRDDLEAIRAAIKKRYSADSRQVTADDLRRVVARLSERWLVEIAAAGTAADAIGSATVADLSVHFQRLLTFAEHATLRRRYDAEFKAILNGFSVKVVLPLKQARGGTPTPVQNNAKPLTAFVGQSFMATDAQVNSVVADLLSALGVAVVTGEKPKADSISEKVKALIEGQEIFVGMFTRRDKIARKAEWTTSPWVIDEKAYAVGRKKRLILLKELGVGSIGGIQGDYEFIEFSRDAIGAMSVRLIQLFLLKNDGLRR